VGNSGVFDYETDPALNNDAVPHGAPEGDTNGGTSIGDLNNLVRQLMAEHALVLRDYPWLDLFRAYVVSKVSDSVARIASVDVTTLTPIGRRVKITGASTVYGWILATTFSGGHTDLTVAVDDGAVVPASITKIEVSLETEDSRAPSEDALTCNVAVNGDWEHWQLGTTFTSATAYTNGDGEYFADQFVILSDGADVVDITKETSVVPVGSRAAARFDIETANKKFMVFQPIEFAETVKYRGKVMSLSFPARRTGTSIDHLRAAIVYRTSTADSLVLDIVDGSNWGGAGTNPTLGNGWSFASTPVDLATLTTSYQTFKVENVLIPTNATNIGLAVWIDDVTTTVGDFLYLGKISLHRGPRALDLAPEPPVLAIARCERFFEKTFAAEVAPVDGIGDLSNAHVVYGSTVVLLAINWRFRAVKRTTPNVLLHNPRSGGAAGQWQTSLGGDLAAGRVSSATERGATIDNTGTFPAGQVFCYVHSTADARLGL